MKSALITVLLVVFVSIVKAQDQDTTIYKSYKLKTDSSRYFAEGPTALLDVAPQFPGGLKKFYRFLVKNVNYPMSTGDIAGKVFVQFIIEKDGHLSDIHVVRSLSPEADAEALRVIRLSPKWKPGEQSNRALRILYTTPISFSSQSK